MLKTFLCSEILNYSSDIPLSIFFQQFFTAFFFPTCRWRCTCWINFLQRTPKRGFLKGFTIFIIITIIVIMIGIIRIIITMTKIIIIVSIVIFIISMIIIAIIIMMMISSTNFILYSATHSVISYCPNYQLHNFYLHSHCNHKHHGLYIIRTKSKYYSLIIYDICRMTPLR